MYANSKSRLTIFSYTEVWQKGTPLSRCGVDKRARPTVVYGHVGSRKQMNKKFVSISYRVHNVDH